MVTSVVLFTAATTFIRIFFVSLPKSITTLIQVNISVYVHPVRQLAGLGHRLPQYARECLPRLDEANCSSCKM